MQDARGRRLQQMDKIFVPSPPPPSPPPSPSPPLPPQPPGPEAPPSVRVLVLAPSAPGGESLTV